MVKAGVLYKANTPIEIKELKEMIDTKPKNININIEKVENMNIEIVKVPNWLFFCWAVKQNLRYLRWFGGNYEALRLTISPNHL